MSKQIKLNFNSSGVLTSTSIDQIRQGDADVKLIASFEGKHNANYIAKFTLTRPDDKVVKGMMSACATPITDYERILDSAYYFAVNGAATLTVFLFSGDQVLAQGQATISIEQTDFDEETTITPDEYDELLELIATKLSKKDGIVIATAVAQIMPLSQWEVGQTFFIRLTASYFSNHTVLCYYDGTTLQLLVDFTDLVHKTGNEVINGKKTFNDGIKSNRIEMGFDEDDYDIVAYYARSQGGVHGNGSRFTVAQKLTETTSWELFGATRYDNGFVEMTIANIKMTGEISDYNGNKVTVANIVKKDTNNVFQYIPQTKEGRVYNNDRQMTDKGYVDNKVADAKEDVEGQIEDIADDLEGVDERVEAIEEKLPTQASQSNKLADRDWVNSTINSLAAFYITKNAQGDPFDTLAELQSATVFYSGGSVRVPTRNDYCLVRIDEEHQSASCRYIYQGGQWEFQFVVNETAFTEDQVKAINSGITQEKVAQIQDNTNDIADLDENKLSKIEAQNKLQAKVVSVDITITPEQWSEDKEFTSENVFGTLGFVNSDDLILFNAISNEDDAYANTYKVRVDDVVSTEANETYVYFKCNDIPTGNVSLRVNLIKKNTILGDMTGFLNVADLDGETVAFQEGKVRVIGGGTNVVANPIVPAGTETLRTILIGGTPFKVNLPKVRHHITIVCQNSEEEIVEICFTYVDNKNSVAGLNDAFGYIHGSICAYKDSDNEEGIGMIESATLDEDELSLRVSAHSLTPQTFTFANDPTVISVEDNKELLND